MNDNGQSHNEEPPPDCLGGLLRSHRRDTAGALLGIVLASTVLLAACSRPSETTNVAPASLAEPPPTTAPTTLTIAEPEPTVAPAQPTVVQRSFTAVPKPAVAAAADLVFDFPIQLYQGESVVGQQEVKFSDLFGHGKPVILNFWAGLCPPCRLEMPDFQKFNTEYQSKVLLFGLDIGPYVGLGSQEDGKALLSELGISYPAGTTPESSVVAQYKVFGMPTTLFMTPDGKVFEKWTGILTQDKLAELTEELLAASGGG